MLRFVLRRVLPAAVLVLGLASAGFLLTQVAPGDYFTDFGRAPRGGRASSGVPQDSIGRSLSCSRPGSPGPFVWTSDSH